MAKLTYADVAKHASADDCWFILNDKAYDVTGFLGDHPGGSQVILDVAGRDCTEAFLAAHPESVMKLTLGPKGLEAARRGEVDTSSAPALGRCRDETLLHWFGRASPP
jgi:L-lactate dehydrogenase (cytochrome)